MVKQAETNMPMYTFNKIVKALKVKSSDLLPFLKIDASWSKYFCYNNFE